MSEESHNPGERPARAAALEVKILPPLTEKQTRCLQFILNYFLKNRFYPTHREIADALGVRSNTAEMFVEPLERKGYIKRQPGKQRNIRLTPEALQRLELDGADVRERLPAA